MKNSGSVPPTQTARDYHAVLFNKKTSSQTLESNVLADLKRKAASYRFRLNMYNSCKATGMADLASRHHQGAIAILNAIPLAHQETFKQLINVVSDPIYGKNDRD